MKYIIIFLLTLLPVTSFASNTILLECRETVNTSVLWDGERFVPSVQSPSDKLLFLMNRDSVPWRVEVHRGMTFESLRVLSIKKDHINFTDRTAAGVQVNWVLYPESGSGRTKLVMLRVYQAEPGIFLLATSSSFVCKTLRQ